jgi:hypothetical protein
MIALYGIIPLLYDQTTKLDKPKLTRCAISKRFLLMFCRILGVSVTPLNKTSQVHGDTAHAIAVRQLSYITYHAKNVLM